MYSEGGWAGVREAREMGICVREEEHFERGMYTLGGCCCCSLQKDRWGEIKLRTENIAVNLNII